MKLQELLKKGIDKLNSEKMQDSAIQARVLLSYILKCSKQALIVNSNLEIELENEQDFFQLIDKLISGIPLQYLTNNQEFMKLNFYVDENVLIPQPDTEVIVEQVIEYCKKIKNENIKILDLCTGSGAIGISIAKYVKNSTVCVSDISNKALQIAKLNAEKNVVHKKMQFIQSDMFNNIEEKEFDIIVSNPPYIKTSIISQLSAQVQKEPVIALDGGKDGLEFYKIIVNNAYKYLNTNGKVFLEIGYDQKLEVLQLIDSNIQYKNATCIKDFANNDRIIIANKR